MITSKKNIVNVTLQPGECFVGDADHRMHTLLGSCVSITLWHPNRRVGAMSHYLLPSRTGPILELDGYYGEEALLLMVRELVRANINPSECQAKIFGGGNMFPQQTRSGMSKVGQKNGDLARLMLAAYKIPVVGESLFGIGHRQLHFNVASGNVWMRHVDPALIVPDAKEDA